MTKKSESGQKEEKTIVLEKQEVSRYEQEATSIESMIMKAIESGISVETMERILAMRKELKAEYAKEKFDSAMANFQTETPEIKKKTEGGKTKSGEVAYYYATLDDIVKQIKPLLAKNGLSYAIKTEVAGNNVKSICIVKHSAGHSEESTMEIPAGTGTGIMSAGQVIAAASTFSKRYAFMNAFGILTGDEDKNGEGLEVVDQTEISDAMEKLDKCMDAKTYNATWNSFSKEVRNNKGMIKHALEIKDLILNAKKNENS